MAGRATKLAAKPKAAPAAPKAPAPAPSAEGGQAQNNPEEEPAGAGGDAATRPEGAEGTAGEALQANLAPIEQSGDGADTSAPGESQNDPSEGQSAAADPEPAVGGLIARAKASRPVYRRGGLVFGDREWVDVRQGDLSPSQAVAILRDPVLTIEAADEVDGPMERLTMEAREAAAARIDQIPVTDDDVAED